MELNDNEKIILEESVKYKKNDYNTRLVITDKRIILDRLSGIFKKKYKVIDSINIDSIKVINDKVCVKSDKETVIISTNDKAYSFSCTKSGIARNIVDKIIFAKTGNNTLDRINNKLSKGLKTTKKIGKGIGTAVGIGITTTLAIVKNRKKILEGIESIKNALKK